MDTSPRIVLIDDNRAWLETLGEYLRAKGYTVWTAQNAAQGLACLAQHRVSLVICDYHLPGMSGLELVRHLRKYQKDVAVLMISSDEEPALVARALAEGARAFVAKTSSPSVLLRKIGQLAEMPVALSSSGSSLRPWERLLPSPSRATRGRSKTWAQRSEALETSER